MRMFALALAWCISSTAMLCAQAPLIPTPQKEHQLLKLFVGEWETVGEGTVGPDQPKMKCKGTISSKMLGGFWVISESKAEVMGTTINALQTIGYDPEKKKYIGTWVDSMIGHMWKYEGTTDGKTLTLEAEGPDFTKPGKTGKFRDVYEFKSKDHITVTSQMKDDDGKWVTFMTGDAKRKK